MQPGVGWVVKIEAEVTEDENLVGEEADGEG